MQRTRLEQINQYIDSNMYASLSELCERFGVSTATMRRNLDELDAKGLIKRVRGGAKSIAFLQAEEPPISVKQTINLAEKRRIAKYCFSLIHDGDSIILDSSSTVYELAVLLSESHLNITVITNDLNIGTILALHPDIDLFQIGGTIRKGYYTAIGAFAEGLWKQIHADKLFLGVDSVNSSFGLMNYRIDEITCKRLMIECSKKTFVVCDNSKFQSTAILQICPISDVDVIITDNGLSPEVCKQFGPYESKILRV